MTAESLIRRPRNPWPYILVTSAYVAAAKAGLTLAVVNQSATAVWPPSGIALAALLIFGFRLWPSILAGAFIVNYTIAWSLTTSLLIAVGNAGEALLGGYLVTRFARGRDVFNRVPDVFRFALLAGVLSTAVSATTGATSLAMFGLASWTDYASIWLTWWLGDATGAMVVTPILVLWATHPRPRWSRAQLVELALLVAALTVVGWVVFIEVNRPLSFLLIPLCVWTGFRFGQREASTATALLSAFALWGTAHGVGAFAMQSPNAALLSLQAFMAVATLVALTVGAAASERQRANDDLGRAYGELESRIHARTRELQISEARLREAQEVAHVGHWQWDVVSNELWWSDELHRIFGVDRTSFRSSYTSFLQLVHPEDRSIIERAMRAALHEHQPYEVEHRIIRPDGTVRVINGQGRVAGDDQGHVARIVGVVQDITERKEAAEIVSRSERRLQTIIDAEPACVKLVSADGLLLDMNRAGLKMIGADTLAQIAGRPILDLVCPDDQDQYREMHRAAISGVPGRLEYRVVGITGHERWVDSHAVPFDALSDKGHVQPAVLSVSSDVTERKQLEDQLRQSHKMEAIGLLAGGIAHDFNNLLTAIGGYTDLVIETLDSADERREDMQEVAKATQRAAALTRQLLAVSRRQILQPTVLDVNGMVVDIQKLLRRTIPENIDLQFALSPIVDAVRADRGQLEQVMLNLAINAADAMPKGGQLRVATETVEIDDAWARRHRPMPPGRYVRLTVSDTGTGMTAEIQAHIFEPFFTTKERGKGTGLGLATVYGIVKQSDGFIWVDSQISRGTTFEIYLPVVHEPAELPVQVAPMADVSGGAQTILLAEDDGAVRRLARDILAHQGYTVLDARDGDEALVRARQYAGPIHLLVTDVVMPGLSGRDLAARLIAERPEVHVLYTSGYTEDVMMRAGFENGLALLAKPFLPADLLRKVRETLGTTE